jgi:meso-butanediol dehydrogenase/(S,S)-butanediol dehydrogenase/diacetyl reductase
MSSSTTVPVAIVTGAGSGIGRAAAVVLSSKGYRLVLVARTLDALEKTGEMCAGESLCISADVGEPGAASEIVDSALARFGRLDVLVNNAGHAPMLPIDRSTPEVIDEVFRVNALAPANLIAACWAVFARQHAEKTVHSLGHRVVNVSSMATADPFPGLFAYAAAKASVNVMVKSVANEGGAIGVKGFSVAPGAVETPMLRGIVSEEALPRSRTLAPETVAGVIVACLLGERDVENGGTIFVPSP